MIITIYGSKRKTRKQRDKEKLAWKVQQEKYKLPSVSKSGSAWTPTVKKNTLETLSLHVDRLTNNIPSKDSGVGVAPKKVYNVYTGDKVIGIGNLHKSNLVPVFKGEDAVDIAHMRR